MNGTAMKICLCCFLSLFAMSASNLGAQAYPNKSVRFIVPFAAGGGADFIARVLSQKLQEKWAVPVIVDNRSGAAGNIAAELTAAASPDGYTIFQFNVSNVIAVSVYKKLNYDPIRDFSPITQIAASPFVFLAAPTLKIESIQQLIALATAQPGKLIYASSGNGGSTHLAGELLKTMAKINITHVPYKGAAPALNDLVAGQVQLMFADPGAGLSQVKAGRVRALGVTSSKRMSLAPELPTIAESGVPGYEAGSWFGVVTPANAPRTVVGKLYSDVKQVLELAEVRERLSGYELIGSTPEQFGQFIKSEMERWGSVVKISGARID